jgi:hypothetical protein
LRFVFRGLFVILLLQIKKRVSPGNSGGGDSSFRVSPFFYFINQINYHNEEFIIVCVGSGGAGADGV